MLVVSFAQRARARLSRCGRGSPCWPRGSPPCGHALGWGVTLPVLSLLSLLEDELSQCTGKQETPYKRAGRPCRATREQPPSRPTADPWCWSEPSQPTPVHAGPPPCAERAPFLAGRAASGSRLSTPPAWARPTPRPRMSTRLPAQSVTQTHQPGPHTSLGEQGGELSSPPHRRQWAL